MEIFMFHATSTKKLLSIRFPVASLFIEHVRRQIKVVSGKWRNKWTTRNGETVGQNEKWRYSKCSCFFVVFVFCSFAFVFSHYNSVCRHCLARASSGSLFLCAWQQSDGRNEKKKRDLNGLPFNTRPWYFALTEQLTLNLIASVKW